MVGDGANDALALTKATGGCGGPGLSGCQLKGGRCLYFLVGSDKYCSDPGIWARNNETYLQKSRIFANIQYFRRSIAPDGNDHPALGSRFDAAKLFDRDHIHLGWNE